MLTPPLASLLVLMAAAGDPSLLAHWRMDRVEDGMVVDASGRGHHAKVSGMPEAGPKVVPGMVGSALVFPPKHTLALTVAKSDDFNVAKGLTVMAWIKPAERSGAHAIACKKGDKSGKPPWPGWRFRYFWSRVMFQFGTADGQQPKASTAAWSVPATFWCHVAATYDGETIRLYVNAVEEAAQPCADAIAPQRRALILANYIGRKNAYPFVGVLDDIKVFSRALTPEEILEQACGP